MTDDDYSVGDEMVEGELKRQEDHFRDWVTKDGSSEYPAVTGRYCLYVSLPYPLAHRTIIGLGGRGRHDGVDPLRDYRGRASPTSPIL